MDQLPEVENKFSGDRDCMLRKTMKLISQRADKRNRIKKLKPSWAPGVDNIVARLLTENAYYLSEPLLPIFFILREEVWYLKSRNVQSNI